MPPKGSKRKKPSPSSDETTTLNHDPYTFDPTLIEIVQPTAESPLPLVLTSEKRHGLYECDYCRTDLSQVPRICCSICPDFDLCLECFTTQGSHMKKSRNTVMTGCTSEINKVGQHVPVLLKHNPFTHGYRVCDSTRYPMFPSLRGVEIREYDSVCNDNNYVVVNDDDDDNHDTNNSCKQDLEEGGGAEIQMKDQANCLEKNIREEFEKSPKEMEEKDYIESQQIIDATPRSTHAMQIMENGHRDSSNDYDKRIESKLPSQMTDVVIAKGISLQGDLPDECFNDQVSSFMENNLESSDTTIHEPNSNVFYEWTDNPQYTWTVEEDLRLLDAIGTLGLGNWVDISEEVAGTSGVSNKNPKRCMERYLFDYLGKYGCILPQYTLIRTEDDTGKDSEENNQTCGVSESGKKRPRLVGSPSFSRQGSSVSMSSSKGTPINKQYRPTLTSSLPGYDKVWPNPFIPEGGSIKLGDDVGRDLSIRAEQTYVKALASASTQTEADAIRKEWEETRLNKPGGPTVLPPRVDDVKKMQGSDLAGYMPRRGDFDIEWDNDAEKLIQDMEFSPSDPLEERELKIKILKIYDARLAEREKRKQFLIDRNLLDFRKKLEEDNKLPADERDLVNRLRLFARFHSAEEHEEFIQNILKAKRIRKEISRLQMYRRMGFTSLADAERFELDRTRREKHRLACEEIMVHEKKGIDTTTKSVISESSSEPHLKKHKPDDGNGNATDLPDLDMPLNVSVEESTLPDSGFDVTNHAMDKPPPNESSSSSPGFDVKKFPLVELLSTKEIAFCQSIEMAPKLYLEVKDALLRESLAAGLLDSENCAQRTVHTIDVQKRGEVYNFILQRGWIPPLP